MDLEKCTSCGECAKVCPIDVTNEYDEGLSDRKAIYKKYAQAIPGAFAITKKGTAPCKATCPAHVSIQGFVALINDGKYKEALKLFKQEHPFPGACGRVCHHPCETECTRGDHDQPLAIQHLHKFLADQDIKEDPFIPEIKEEREEKIAIIGSGPAGLTCASFLALKGYKVTVFEKLPVAGGMMAVGIPDYRLPRKKLNEEISLIEQSGVTIKTSVTFGKDITLQSLKDDGFKSVFIAAGLHGSRALGIEGEKFNGVLQGVAFLRDASLDNKKVTVGEKVIVIGGGNVAVDVALTARRLGCKDVTMVCLEKKDEMPAWDYEIKDAEDENVKIINSLGPNKFLGDKNSVTGLEFKKCTDVFDSEGRFNPQYDLNDIVSLEGDTIIVAIGQMGEFDFAQNQNISIGARGGLDVDINTFQTPLGWVFAGGDAVYGPKSVVDAVACGKEVAESIDRYINGLDLKEGRQKEWSFYKPDIDFEPQRKRVEIKHLPVEEREGNFNEVAAGFSEEDVRNEAARCLKCGVCSECYQCVDACLAGAIDHNQTVVESQLDVGAVILCPGTELFDPSSLNDAYQYNSSPNVLTSLEFERILSASGPTLGHLARPSDGKEPKKIAWLQCIGSRDKNRCDNGYCSSVCCMYAIKDAMIAKEHSEKELDCAIFNMDIRTFGKDYELYYDRAKNKENVRFEKARIHTVDKVRENGDLTLRYANEDGKIISEDFDMVVLSVGLTISKSTAELAKKLDIEVDQYNFVKNDPMSPLSTSRPGVFACGVFQGPKDIPSSVVEASAASCVAGGLLAEARGTCIKTVEIPDEIDIKNVEPRVGVFVCDCGINIAGVINVPDIEQYAATIPNVAYTGENLFTCSQDAQDQMKDLIIEHKLNRIVVASCTPKTHEPIFMDTLESCGLNKYLFEMANIRNQNSWCHSDTPEQATEKAKDLIRMAVARAVNLRPLHDKQIPVTRKALVIGGGIAGMNAALGLAEQNYEVILMEKESNLGGFSKKLTETIEGKDIQIYLDNLINKVQSNAGIQVITQSLIVGFSGFKGNFTTEILVGPGMYERKIEHGVIILATGAKEYEPTEYLYGKDRRVVTQIELSNRLEEEGTDDLNSVVMIQCVGSRNENNPNCSRVCCQAAIKNALHIKKLRPETEVYILYRDIRMYGLLEDYYTEARNLGVMFFRYDSNSPPVVESVNDILSVTFHDHILGKNICFETDLLALSAGVVAEDTEELSSIMKLARNPQGFFIEAHVKLRPVEMAQEGIFICGTAHTPQLITETIAQAMAAASRACTFLSQPFLTLSAVTAEVEGNLCASCLICIRSCPYEVPKINEDGVSQIDTALCHGCGVCASECPAKAIKLNWYEDNQILSKVESLLEGVL